MMKLLSFSIAFAIVFGTIWLLSPDDSSQFEIQLMGTYHETGESVVITESLGGDMLTAFQMVETFKRNGTRVVIDGPCWSACTVIATAGCLTENAVLYFHSPSFRAVPIDVTQSEIDEALMSARSRITDRFPDEISRWMDENFALESSEWTTLKPEEVRQIYPSWLC